MFGEIITPNMKELIGKTDSESIQNALDYAHKIGANSVTIPRINKRTGDCVWVIDKANSNTEIIPTYEEGIDEVQTDVEFEHQVEIMDLPLRRATLADEITAKKAIEEYLDEKVGDVNYNDAAKHQVHLSILKRMKLQDVMETVDTEVELRRSAIM